MRIVAGSMKGRRLRVPGTNELRPTSERMREAMFNIIEHGLSGWQGSLTGASVVDLFCGTGALALEALSRGATHATLIDNARGALYLAKKNAAHLKILREVTLLSIDATRLMPPPCVVQAPCAVAFVDAPYNMGLSALALAGLARWGWVADGALVVVETAMREQVGIGSEYTQLDERIYGAAKVMFLQYLP